MGDELQKKQEKQVEQVIQQPVFEHHYEAMSAEEITLFAEEQIERLETFEEAYKHRMRMLEGQGEPVVVQQPIVQAPIEQPPVQPEMSEKDKKSALKKAEKKRKKGLKKTPGATAHTLNLMDAMVQYRKRKAPPMIPTIREFKNEMFRKEYRPEMFGADYVGEHFFEVKEEYDKLKKFVVVFRDDTAEFNSLTPLEQERARMLRDVYDKASMTFFSALEAHGLKYTEQALVPMNAQELAQRRSHEADVDAMREVTEGLSQRKERFLEEESERVIEVGRQRLAGDFRQMREDMRGVEEYSFITSEKICNQYQYDTLRDVKKLLDNNPTQYAQNKEVLDRAYQEVLKLMDAAGTMSAEAQAITAVTFDKQLIRDEAVQRAVVRKSDIYQKKYQSLLRRTQHLISGMKFVVLGKEMTEGDAIVAAEYGIVSEQREAALRDSKARAEQYGDTYRTLRNVFAETVNRKIPNDPALAEKLLTGSNGRFMMLMKPEDPVHNERVIDYLQLKENLAVIKQTGEDTAGYERDLRRRAKELAVPYLQGTMNFNTYAFERSSNEDLMAQQEGYMNVALSGMMVADLAKEKDYEHPEKSIKEVFEGDNKQLFMLKCRISQAAMDKSRALAMIEAYRKGVLTQEALSPAERVKFGAGADAVISADQVLEYAKKLYKQAVTQIEAARNQFGTDQGMIEAARKHKRQLPPLKHQQFERIHNAVTAEREAIGKAEGMSPKATCEEMVERYTIGVQRLREQLTVEEDEEMRAALQEKIQEMEEKIEHYEIDYALTLNTFRLCGREAKMPEAIFRSFSSAQSQQSFRDMGEAAYLDMCKKLSAGHLLAKTPEEIEAARAQNLEGLNIYKERIRMHYEAMEAKYHRQIPPVEYIWEHLAEIEAEIANTQVDNNLVKYIPEMFDDTNEQDVRTKHLIKSYNTFGGAVVLKYGMIGQGYYNERDNDATIAEFMKEDQASLDYLEQHRI